ncbi:hypothetical protein [Roseococcus pinisoli]|uniref:HMA domain-containing protein n=1 Tax=Roseococcus pinisoli TaxID=2835040 RepID=A0ABS5QC65_9PROT|nr:hypothetical protein [Roseococcus pinisoli]MBS7811255.1 hypothetical protein [Roseococcus pinisoli]
MPTTLIEVSVEGLNGRASRAAVMLAIEARDPAAVVEVDAVSGQVRTETTLDLAEFLHLIEGCGCRPLLQPEAIIHAGGARSDLG